MWPFGNKPEHVVLDLPQRLAGIGRASAVQVFCKNHRAEGHRIARHDPTRFVAKRGVVADRKQGIMQWADLNKAQISRDLSRAILNWLVS